MAIIQEVFAPYDPMPFGLELAEFTDFALAQFQARLGHIARARGKSLDQVLYDHRGADAETPVAAES